MKNWKKLRVCLPLLAAAAVGAGTLAPLAGYTPPVFEAAEKPAIDLSFLEVREIASDVEETEVAVVTEAAKRTEEKASPAKKNKKKKRSVPTELLATATTSGALASGDAAVPVEMISEPSLYRDGTYTGTGTGFNGPITVSVTVSGGRIAGIAVVSASDNEPFLSNAKTLLSRILGSQTTNVDTVSGATYSSRGLIRAVRDALAKAGGQHLPMPEESPAAITPTVSESMPTESEETTKPGQFPYPDGTYFGTGEGRNGTIKIRLTLKDQTISSIEVVEQEEDAAFFERAAKVIERILQMQTPKVDSVSGATLSSEGIKEAVADALAKAKAAAKKGEEETDPKEEEKSDPEWPTIPKKLWGRFPYPDGVYVGYGDGRNGEIAVKVVLLDQTVQRILVTEQEEDPAYYKRAVGVLSDVLMGQTIDVDAVSGATLSSEGLLDAIADALENARAAAVTPTPEPEEATPTPEPEEATPTPEPEEVTPTPEPEEVMPTPEPEEVTPTPEPGENTPTPVPEEATPTSGAATPTEAPDEGTPTPEPGEITPTAIPGEGTPTPVPEPGDVTTVPTPTAVPTLTPTPKPTPTSTPKPTATPKPTVKPTATPRPTATPKPTGAFVDGTYTASAKVSPDAWEDFDAYTLKVTVTIKDDAITSVTAPTTGIDAGNHFYINRALNGTRTKPGIPAQAVALGKLKSTDSLQIDVVSSATCSSKGLIEGIRKALEKAKRT